MADFLALDIAHTAIVGLLFLSGFLICCLSFCFARMKHDPERRGMHFFKVAAVFFQFYCFFDIVTHILIEIVVSSRDSFGTIALVINELSITSELFGFLTSIFVFLALVRIGAGILRASRPPHKLTDGKPAGIGASLPKFIGWAAYGLAGVLVVLTIAYFGIFVDYYLRVFGDSFYYGISEDDYMAVINRSLSGMKLKLAMLILLFVAALLTLTWTIAVLILTKAKPKGGPTRRMMRPATYLLVCGILFLIARTYQLAEMATIYDVVRVFEIRSAPTYLSLVEAILHFIPIYVILVLLMLLARMRDGSGGLWSTYVAQQAQAQQWTPGAPWPGYPQQQQQQWNQGQQQQQQQPPLQPPQAIGQHGMAPTPPQSVSPPVSTPPPQIPTPEPPTSRAFEHPVGSTELPLTHPPTEWELPTNAPGSNALEAQPTAAGSSAAPAPGSPKAAVPA